MRKALRWLLLAIACAMPLSARAVEIGEFDLTATDDITQIVEGTDYSFASNVLTVKTTTPVTLKMKRGTEKTAQQIVIDTTSGDVSVTLDNLSIDASRGLGVISVKGDQDCELIVKGVNTIKSTYSSGSPVQLANRAKSDITIKGDGTLNASNTGGNGVIYSATYGNGSLTIEGDVTVNAAAEGEDASGIERFGLTTIQGNAVVNLTPGEAAYGIWSRNSCRGVIIGGNAQVTTNGGERGIRCSTSTSNQVTIKDKAQVTIRDAAMYGITGYGPVTIKDQALVTITLTGTETNVHGIYADRSGQDLRITDQATVSVSNGENGNFARGLRADGSVIIDGSATVNVTGGTMQGIYANAGVTVGGNANVTLKEMRYGMSGGVTISENATVLIADTTDRAILNKFAFVPDVGKCYHVKTGADHASAVSAYYVKKTTELSDSSSKYLYAVPGEIPMFQVVLHTNQGVINSGMISSYMLGIGAALPTDVTRAGYTFFGWYESSDLTGNAVTQIAADEQGDKQYYAKWLSADAGVSSVSVLGQSGKIEGSEISVLLPYGTKIPQESQDIQVMLAQGASISALTSSDGGATWTFVVTAADGRTTARYTMTITVDGRAPVFEVPEDETIVSVTEGERAALKVSATDEPRYQWQISRDGGLSFENINDAQDATFVTDGLALKNNGDQYRCVASNNYGKTIGPVFTISVKAMPKLPKTGDNSLLGWWLALAAGSAVGLLRLSKRVRREN